MLQFFNAARIFAKKFGGKVHKFKHNMARNSKIGKEQYCTISNSNKQCLSNTGLVMCTLVVSREFESLALWVKKAVIPKIRVNHRPSQT